MCKFPHGFPHGFPKRLSPRIDEVRGLFTLDERITSANAQTTTPTAELGAFHVALRGAFHAGKGWVAGAGMINSYGLDHESSHSLRVSRTRNRIAILPRYYRNIYIYEYS